MLCEWVVNLRTNWLSIYNKASFANKSRNNDLYYDKSLILLLLTYSDLIY